MPKVSFQVADGIATVTINRPEMRNAVDRETADAIAALVNEIDQRSDVAVCILTGVAPGFCSGMDLKAFVRGEIGRVEGRGFAGFTERPPRKPTIAAIEGFALAGGFELALACDLIVVASDARLGLPEVRRGLVANAGGLVRLPRQLPSRIAAELVLTGEIVTADRLAQHGLFNRVVDPGGALAAADALARLIAANAPLALAASKSVMQQADDWTSDQKFARQREITAPVFTSNDAKEGALAFIEKRSPVWRGN
jgi:enoyl-CoA hydratase